MRPVVACTRSLLTAEVVRVLAVMAVPLCLSPSLGVRSLSDCVFSTGGVCAVLWFSESHSLPRSLGWFVGMTSLSSFFFLIF